ncbi:hypothetical protein SAMD00019534_075300, partial [Acytostelium subglobosum LB1]|uniref:hypothetical protein n=1 Tax=Acytostelium subglobosum LB1 TaxID=1410327 RepID=UPI000644E8A4
MYNNNKDMDSISIPRPIINFYGAPSPNVVKVHLMFKELGIPFSYHELNIRRGEQYSPDFVRINPNGKLPAIVDYDVPGDEPISVFESGNILLYLSTKYKRFMPSPSDDPRGHTEVLNWLFWQMSNLGPIFGNWYHFNVYAQEKHQYSIQRFYNELRRLFHVLNSTLATRTYIASNDEYTIADMACYPWTRYIHITDLKEDEFPHLFRWLAMVKSRPAVQELEKMEEDQKTKPANPPSPTAASEERKYISLYGRSSSSNQETAVGASR